MKATILISLLLLFLLTAGMTTAKEVIKWTDENGKVHYSDRKPKDKNVSAEKIDVKEAPLQGLTTEELRSQQKRVIDYQLKLKREREAREQKRTPSSTSQLTPSPAPSEQTLEQETRVSCRNKYKTSTKKLVECFKSVAK